MIPVPKLASRANQFAGIINAGLERFMAGWVSMGIGGAIVVSTARLVLDAPASPFAIIAGAAPLFPSVAVLVAGAGGIGLGLALVRYGWTRTPR